MEPGNGPFGRVFSSTKPGTVFTFHVNLPECKQCKRADDHIATISPLSCELLQEAFGSGALCNNVKSPVATSIVSP